MSIPLNTVHRMDIFDLCDQLEDQSVDCILCDLPYGTTACSWDTIIPFEPMWSAFKRIIKPKGAIVLTASQPFTSALVMSNIHDYAYSWAWRKTRVTGFANAKTQPLRVIEDVCVFGCNFYYPQGLRKFDKIVNKGTKAGGATNRGGLNSGKDYFQEWTNYPVNVLDFESVFDPVHPTQKPVALFRYLIRTYTQVGELVFDPCCGSGTTAYAARVEGRNYVVGDNGVDEKTGLAWAEVTQKRLDEPYTLPMRFES